MKSTIEKLPKSEVKISIEVDDKEFSKYYDRGVKAIHVAVYEELANYNSLLPVFQSAVSSLSSVPDEHLSACRVDSGARPCRLRSAAGAAGSAVG